MIELNNITKKFTLHNQGRTNISVFKNLNLKINPGEIVALTGPSGVGKSSILKMIYGNYVFQSGEIKINNYKIDHKYPVDSEKYDYKKNWMDQLIKQLKSLSKKNSNIILAGDFNVIPAAEDVYNVKSFEDDALYRLEIRKKFREMLNLGFSDVYRHFNEDKEGYTFWDYMRGAWQKNNGMRIDHFLVSSSIIDNIKGININKDPRGREKPSDHTPIEINLA